MMTGRDAHAFFLLFGIDLAGPACQLGGNRIDGNSHDRILQELPTPARSHSVFRPPYAVLQFQSN
jgi:hypothetical protein